MKSIFVSKKTLVATCIAGTFAMASPALACWKSSGCTGNDSGWTGSTGFSANFGSSLEQAAGGLADGKAIGHTTSVETFSKSTDESFSLFEFGAASGDCEFNCSDFNFMTQMGGLTTTQNGALSLAADPYHARATSNVGSASVQGFAVEFNLNID